MTLLSLLACNSKADKKSKEKPYVVMLSIDGFRHDYAEMHNAVNLLEMAKNGASAEMIPSFPSKTFPNHYTLVTGLYPANHGIVGNSFFSREKKDFYAVGKKQAVTDGSWYGGTPLWVLAEQNQMKAASYYWVGSEAAIQGIRPSYFEKYNHGTPNDDRIDKVLEWLSLSEQDRPHMVTLYFALVDDAGHAYGPKDERTKTAVLEADRLVGRLRDELAKLNLPIYLIVTADHGMTEINRGIDMSEVDFGDAILDYSSTMLMVYSDDSVELQSIKNQLADKKQLTVLSEEEAAKKLGFKNEDRVGDLIALAQPPAIILKSPKPVYGGTHGYDPKKYQDMHAAFYIEGPNIMKNLRLEPFENVNVYPLVADLLGLEIKLKIDGQQEIIDQVIEK